MIPLLQREVPPERITFMEELGRGVFGKVNRGALRELPTVEIFDKTRYVVSFTIISYYGAQAACLYIAFS